jgi:hypothetical protein
MTALKRAATKVAMYNAERTSARPPQTLRLPNATVAVKGGQTNQGRDLPTIQLSQFREFGQENA